MSLRNDLRSVTRWLRRVRARRRARLAGLTRADEQVYGVSQRARADGVPYDTWRQALPVPRRTGF